MTVEVTVFQPVFAYWTAGDTDVLYALGRLLIEYQVYWLPSAGWWSAGLRGDSAEGLATPEAALAARRQTG